MIKLGVSGACGKMGKRIISLANDDKAFKPVLGLEFSGHLCIGQTIDNLEITADCAKIKECDCLIDFSSPEATLNHLNYAVKYKKRLVIGTTGLDSAQLKKIKTAAKKIPIVFSPNMSVGVNLVFQLLAMSAAILKKYQVNIEEAHHIHKKDSPSGTAKKMADIINNQGFNISYEQINARREGEIVGDHKVIFESPVDKIEISHHAKTRDIFAQGALVAAKWLSAKKSGLYSMADVLFGQK